RRRVRGRVRPRGSPSLQAPQQGRRRRQGHVPRPGIAPSAERERRQPFTFRPKKFTQNAPSLVCAAADRFPVHVGVVPSALAALAGRPAPTAFASAKLLLPSSPAVADEKPPSSAPAMPTLSLPSKAKALALPP